MAIITKTLKSTGGDYSSIVTWESGEQTNLVTDGDSHVLECYVGTTTTGNWQADGSLNESFTLSGWTTGASNTITIKAASGEGHAGVIDGGFRLKNTSAATTVDEQQAYVRLYDLQVSYNGGSTHAAISTSNSNDDIEFHRCIFTSESDNSATRAAFLGASGPFVIRNCLFVVPVATADNAIVIDGRDTAGEFSNNTIIGNVDVTAASPTWDVRNNVFFGNVDALLDGSGTQSHNAFSGTGAFGTNQVTTLDSTDFNDFANGDYSPASGGDLIDAGVDLSGTFTDDIAGNTRGATFDIGAYEYITAGATEAAVSYGVTANNQNTADASALAQSSNDASADQSYGGDANAFGAVSHQSQMGMSATGIISIEASITENTLPGVTVSADAAAFGVTQDQAQASSSKTADAVAYGIAQDGVTVDYTDTAEAISGGAVAGSVLFGLTLNGTKTADATAYASILADAGLTGTGLADASAESLLTAGALLGYSATGEVIAQAATEGAVTFNIQAAAQVAADASALASTSMTAGLAASIIAEAAAEAGITFGTISNVTFIGTSISGSIVTPDGRTFTVTAEARVFTVFAESRNFTVDD